MRRVRADMGLTNLKLMIPFCRTPRGAGVVELLAEHGLRRGEDGLEVYVMCEIPSNVILAGEFAEIFDGFSIGSNDLRSWPLGLIGTRPSSPRSSTSGTRRSVHDH